MNFLTQLPVTYLLSTITTIVLVAYTILLYRITGRNRSADKLVGAFTIVFLLGTVYHLWLFGSIASDIDFLTYDSLMSRVLFSAQYSLEMFLANTLLFKGEVKEVLQGQAFMYQSYLVLYGMAILTSGFSIFHFLSRRLYNWFWLTFHKATRKAHIFIGVNDASLCLSSDIMAHHSDERVIFIDLPDQQDNPQGVSIWDIVGGFFKDSKEHEELSSYVVLKAGKGIGKITKWLKKEENDVYILSDSQEQNVSILEALWEHKELKCRIYCHAKKEGLINRYDNIADVEDRVRFVDSSFLSVVALKKWRDNAMLPVKYVDVAEDTETKRRLGYVTSEFHCAVIGFGETGKEALKFLYEFGAFPNKDNGKVPFKCHIFDNNLAKELGEFGVDLTTLRSPVAKEPEFELHSCAVDTIEFRTEMSKIIGRLNYIIVCLGNDNMNVETALNIVECAAIENRDTSNKFCIAIKQSRISKLNQDTLDNANKTYNNCIHTFGLTKDIWTLHLINNDELENEAKRFYGSYSELSKKLNLFLGWEPNPTWDDREQKGIRSENYKNRCKARRQKSQDYSNSLHKTTKQILCEPGYTNEELQDKTLAEQARCDYYNKLSEAIFTVNRNKEGKETKDGPLHCKEEVDTTTEEILKHLAVCEHLRWEASHILMGYRPTNGKTCDLKKLHDCIKPYNDLEEYIKHYDWLVVKNSLICVEKEEKAYDRNTAFGTLRLITKLGFKITRKKV